MYKLINLQDFRDAFVRMGRESVFTYDGLEILYNYLEERYGELGLQLDVIDICCKFSEYTFNDAVEAYDAPPRSTLSGLVAHLNKEATVIHADVSADIIIIIIVRRYYEHISSQYA